MVSTSLQPLLQEDTEWIQGLAAHGMLIWRAPRQMGRSRKHVPSLPTHLIKIKQKAKIDPTQQKIKGFNCPTGYNHCHKETTAQT